MSNKIRSLARAREKQQAKDGTITVTLAQLNQSIGALSELTTQPIAIRTSFQIGKIIKAVNSEMEQYNASRTKLCEQYSNKDIEGKAIMVGADGKPIVEGQPGRYDIPKEKMPEFEKELAELLAIETQVPGQQIKVSDLNTVNIAPALLMNLEWLITDS